MKLDHYQTLGRALSGKLITSLPGGTNQAGADQFAWRYFKVLTGCTVARPHRSCGRVCGGDLRLSSVPSQARTISRILGAEIVLLPSVKNVGAVVFRASCALPRPSNKRRPHAGNFVGSHRRPHAGAVYHDATSAVASATALRPL